MRDDDKEGCGYGVTFRGWMSSACRWHDQPYLAGSWHQQNLTRKQVDRQFLRQLLVLAGRNPAKKAVSYAAYGVVRLVGSLFWEGKK